MAGAGRFIQKALREWAYASALRSARCRTSALAPSLQLAPSHGNIGAKLPISKQHVEAAQLEQRLTGSKSTCDGVVREDGDGRPQHRC
jgi:hypothetical protein